MSRTAVLTVALVLVAVVSLLWMRARRDSQAISPSINRETEADPGRETGRNIGSAVGIDDSATSGRERVEYRSKDPALQGRVLSADDQPVPGAMVSWTALGSVYFGSAYVWDAVDRNVAGTSLTTESGASGGFTFVDEPRDGAARHSVLWVTAPGFTAEAVLFDLDALTPHSECVVRLGQGQRIAVRVLDGAERPLAGAVVEQCGVRTPPERRASRVWTAAHRAFHRRAVTDASGRLPLALSEFPATFTLIARQGTGRSQPWFSSIDGVGEEVVLRMGPRFQAEGRVRWPVGATPPTDGLVTISGATNAYLLVLGQARVAADGTWGPSQVPLFGATRFVYRLEASGFGVELQTLPAPEADALVRVDFAPQLGLSLPVSVVDGTGQPVAGAEVYLRTGTEGQTIDLQAHTDESGAAVVHGIPPGAAALDVTASEFPPVHIEPVIIGPDPPALLRIELAPAAELIGRVMHGGEPVSEFEIAWWTDALFSGQPPNVMRFSEATDGRFALQGLPRSRISLLACSNEYPRSEARTVDLSAGSVEPVEIELPAPIAARGRTVDAVTGEAVSGAVLQQFTNAGAAFVHAWGVPSVSGPDGGFTLQGLAPGDNRLTIHAAGYSDRLVALHAREGAPLDLGPQPLFRAMSVVLEYVGTEPRGVEGLTASLIAAQFHPAQPFGSDGTSRFQDVAPGRVVVQLVRDDGSSEQQILDLLPADEHILPVGGEVGVRLEVALSETARADLVEPWIGLRERSPSGLRTRSAFLDGTSVVFSCAPGAELAVTLWAAGKPLLTHLQRVGVEGARILLEPETSAATLEVVDASGRAVPHAQVHLYTESGSGWTHVESADATGRVTIAGLPQGALAGAVSAVHGMRFGVPVEPGPSTLVTRIELVAEAELNVRLVQGGKAAAGIQVRAMAAGDTYLVGYATTDDDGRAVFSALGEGSYTVHVEHPGLFRASFAADTGSRAAAPAFQVHPLGGLAFELKRPDGTPLAGAEVDVEHASLAGSLSSWLAQRRVRLIGEPRTNGGGRLSLPELPAGTVRWRAIAPDGTSRSGTAEVAAGGVTAVGP